MTEQSSEIFRTLPKDTETFRNLPQPSEAFRNFPNTSERKENHTLTVREAARMFEHAGVARTERSIINWCHPDQHGISRLDCFYDANERKYFITPQSVERAIEEEQAKIKAGTIPQPSETTQHIPNGGTSERHGREKEDHETVEHTKQAKEFEQEIMDLKITNKAKDYFIEQLQEDRERFVQEREQFVQRLVTQSQTIGELKTQLLQLEAPEHGSSLRDDASIEGPDAAFVETEIVNNGDHE